MKKVLIVIIGVILFSATALLAGISTDDAAGLLKNAIKNAGYNCNVEVEDYDKNGVMDFAVEYVSGGEGDKIIVLLAAVTGGVAGMLPNLSWKVDKVFVVVEEDIFYTTASKCKMCMKVIESDSSTEEEVKECLKTIWEEKE
jgi:hypothetical protein